MKRFVRAGALLVAGALSCIWTSSVSAGTLVGGLVIADTVWSKANSPYVVQDSVVVVNDAILTIEPGVEVRFQPDTRLEIAVGTLHARGTANDHIIFTEHQVGKSWQQILFQSDSVDATFDQAGQWMGGSIIEYAVVEFAGSDDVDGAVAAEDCAPLIANNTLWRNHNGALLAERANGMRIIGNEIVDNTVCGAPYVTWWTMRLYNVTVHRIVVKIGIINLRDCG